MYSNTISSLSKIPNQPPPSQLSNQPSNIPHNQQQPNQQPNKSQNKDNNKHPENVNYERLFHCSTCLKTFKRYLFTYLFIYL